MFFDVPMYTGAWVSKAGRAALHCAFGRLRRAEAQLGPKYIHKEIEMGVNEIQVKSILQKSNLPESIYVINPYTGCVHGCVYCYARFMKRFTAHAEAWGSFVDAKINAPKVLENQLRRRRKALQEVVFLSSVTDPYQPPENKYKLTRKLLEVLLEYQVPISILTKSDLVVRDIDLLNKFDRCTVGISLMTLDDELAHRLEPRAASPSRRLRALKSLRENGIRTSCFVSPYLPRLSDINQIVRVLSGSIDEIGVEAMNTRGGNWPGVENILKQYYPEWITDCKRLLKDDNYWREIEVRVRQLAGQSKIKMTGFYQH
jgi:DNA repair photolyase